MPYISRIERDSLKPSLTWLITDLNTEGFTVGQLNYVMSCLVNGYLHSKGLRYASIAEVQGVYTGALDEFNERVARPYELEKLEENGTVWTCMDPPDTPLSNEQVEALIISDDHGNTWMRCDGDCGLHVTGPGRVECDHCNPEDDPDFKGE